jgi:hypothetical protein
MPTGMVRQRVRREQKDLHVVVGIFCVSATAKLDECITVRVEGYVERLLFGKSIDERRGRIERVTTKNELTCVCLASERTGHKNRSSRRNKVIFFFASRACGFRDEVERTGSKKKDML